MLQEGEEANADPPMFPGPVSADDLAVIKQTVQVFKDEIVKRVPQIAEKVKQLREAKTFVPTPGHQTPTAEDLAAENGQAASEEAAAEEPAQPEPQEAEEAESAPEAAASEPAAAEEAPAAVEPPAEATPAAAEAEPE